MGTVSPSLFLHIAGVLAISQLFFGRSHYVFTSDLNKNATGIVHDAVDQLLELLPFSSVVTTVMMLVYLVAVLYGIYLARSVSVGQIEQTSWGWGLLVVRPFTVHLKFCCKENLLLLLDIIKQVFFCLFLSPVQEH